VLALGIESAETAGYDVVLSVHDEVIADTHRSVEGLIECMTQFDQEWMKGLPLAAGGFESVRYKKD
jgi:DNA polymerase bacteriophage-type